MALNKLCEVMSFADAYSFCCGNAAVGKTLNSESVCTLLITNQVMTAAHYPRTTALTGQDTGLHSFVGEQVRR